MREKRREREKRERREREKKKMAPSDTNERGVGNGNEEGGVAVAAQQEEFKQGVPPPGMGPGTQKHRDRGERNEGGNEEGGGNNTGGGGGGGGGYYGGGNNGGGGGGYGGSRFDGPSRGGHSRGPRGRMSGRGGGSYRGRGRGWAGDEHGGGGGGARGKHFQLEGVVESLSALSVDEKGEDQSPSSGGIAGVISSQRYRGGGLEKFEFKEEDVISQGFNSKSNGKLKLAVGDRVQFYKFEAAPGQATRATRIRVIDAKKNESGQHPDNSLQSGTNDSDYTFHLGIIVALKETYGFLLSLRSGAQYFFHFSEFLGSNRNSRVPPPELQIGVITRFFLARNPATGKDIGKSLCLLSENGRPQFSLVESEEGKSKRMVGKILKKPSDLALPDDFGDGFLEFSIESEGEEKKDEEGEKGKEEGEKVPTQRAIFAKSQLNESHVHIEVNDLIFFDCYKSDKVDLAVAKNVVLMRKPHENFDVNKRELGAISAMKGSFGFITCTERIADVFLHLSQVPDVPKEELSVGTDVEFSVIRGAENGRLQAINVTLAEPGSAVFEEIEEEVHEGTVLEKIPNSNMKKTNPTLILSGLIEGLVNGKLEKLPFLHSDKLYGKQYPKQGDRVTFQILTDLKREKAAQMAGRPGLGRRATKVAIVALEGKVAATKGNFGFIEVEESPTRIFFHVSEILEGAELHVGDTVTFFENKGTARKVRLQKKAEVQKEAEVQRENEERPEHLRWSKSERSVIRLAKGPDGTRGFSREYQESRGVKVPVEEKPPESPLQLNVSAAPFIPASKNG